MGRLVLPVLLFFLCCSTNLADFVVVVARASDSKDRVLGIGGNGVWVASACQRQSIIRVDGW